MKRIKKILISSIEGGLIVSGVFLMIPALISLAACEALFIICDKVDDWKGLQ